MRRGTVARRPECLYHRSLMSDTTTELRRGIRIELEGDPYLVVEISTQTPSARGATTLVKTKLRNLKTKQLSSRTFKAGERFKVPDFEIRACQYLYDEGGTTFYFMDETTYEQHPIQRESIEHELGYLLPNATVRAYFFEGQCIAIEVQPTVVLEVVECEPGFRGDTATHTTKPARLETGLEVRCRCSSTRGTGSSSTPVRALRPARLTHRMRAPLPAVRARRVVGVDPLERVVARGQLHAGQCGPGRGARARGRPGGRLRGRLRGRPGSCRRPGPRGQRSRGRSTRSSAGCRRPAGASRAAVPGRCVGPGGS